MVKTSLFLFSLIFLGVGLLLWFGLVVTNNNTIEGFSKIQNVMSDNEIILTVFRIGLLLVIYNYWTSLCQWFGQYKKLDEDIIVSLIRSRNKMMIWLFIVEIIINQNLIGLILEKIL